MTRLDYLTEGDVAVNPRLVAELLNALAVIVNGLCETVEVLHERQDALERWLGIEPPEPPVLDAPDISTYQEDRP